MTAALAKPAVPAGETGPAEVQRRTAILRRFRELLSQQRDRFRRYLEVLDKQRETIERGSADDLIAHVELEEKIVGDIFAIQKVIDPMEDLYRSAFPFPDSGIGPGSLSAPADMVLSGDARELPDLRRTLEDLKAEAVIRSGRNRDLLARRMEEIRREMKTLRANPYAIHHSAYGEVNPSLVDIQG
ncbi:MAG: flagellar biosynthesis protein FlgN [Treponema sp.]|jgi:hypothetical protein|nr:flagellar biosynthesis protein FlgN [Treponema sp.]